MKNLKVNMRDMLYEFAVMLDGTKGLKKIMDEDGDVTIPFERYPDFCHDMGIILGRAVTKVTRRGE